MAQAISLQIGMEPFPGFCLSRPLGRGSFGQVWEAKTPRGKGVAIKFLPCDARQAASREIRALQDIRQLRHPHLIRIESIWCDKGYIAVVMELADGSLADLLEISVSQFGTPLDAEYVCHLLSQAALALDFLNARQHRINDRLVAIQHCDIKPSNLLIFGETLKVADFGLSSSLCSRLETRFRAGTLDYCAPEVFQGHLSSQTDQYSLAVTYCLLRGGCVPFTDTPQSFQSRYARSAADLGMVSEEERPILARALHAVPQNRWSSCGEMVARLSRALRGGSGSNNGTVKRPVTEPGIASG